MTNRAIQVIVIHEKDTAWPSVRTRIETLMAEGYLWPFVILTVGPGGTIGADPSVEVVNFSAAGASVSHQTTLLGYLAGLGSIHGVTTVALRCDSAASPDNAAESADIDSAVRKIDLLLVRFATSLARRTLRVAVIGEEEQAPGAPFFAKDANANVIVLPRDVSMNRAVARPVLRENGETFVAHAATEICSILGLWTSMDASPLESIEMQPSGMPGYTVHLVGSRVKALLAPPLPVNDLVDDSGVLPLPRGFSPVDNLAVLVERYADVVFPANMRFAPLERPDASHRENWPSLGKAYLREFWRTFKGFPSIVRRGFQGEMDAVGAVALDRLLGGAEGRIRPIIPDENGSADHIISDDLVENLIRDIEFRDGRPVVGGVTTEQWESLIVGVLGIADGNDQSQANREVVMPSSILVRDKTFLAPDRPTVSEMIRAVMPPRETELELDESPDILEGDGLAELEDGHAPQEVTMLAQGDVDLEALRDAVRRGGMGRPEATVEPDEEPDLVAGGSVVEVDRAGHTLIGYLTRLFDREFTKSEDSTVECLNELRQFPARFRAAEFGRVSWAVVVTFALSLSAVLISLATHAPFRAVFSMDWMSRRNRDFLWVGFSTLVLVVAVAALLSTGRRSWQGRTVIIAAVCAGILAMEYVLFDPVRNAILRSGHGLVDATVAIAIFAMTTTVMTVAIIRNWSSEDPIRRRVGRLMAIILWVYATFAMCSYIAGPESFIIDWSDQTRHKFLVAVQFVAWVSLFVSVGVVVAIRVEQQNMYGREQARFAWAQDNLVHSIDARRHLRTAYTHWLILASALSRIVWHPLGREATERTAFDGSLTGDESILKFDLAEIELSSEGRTALLAQLKQRFVRKGWLKVQFDIARSTYQTRRAFVTGDPMEDHDPVGCPSVPSVESLLEDAAQGDRFEFAKVLLAGEVDQRLLAGATNENLEDVYSSLMLDERMHTVTRAQNEFGTGFDFLADIVPEEPAALPPRLLSTLYVASDDATRMNSHLWWPDAEIIARPECEFVERHSGVAMSTERMNDSVVLMAVLVDISRDFRNTDVKLIVEASLAAPSVGEEQSIASQDWPPHDPDQDE